VFHMKQRDPVITQVFAAYGSASTLAKELGLTRQCVGQWKKIPLKYVREISKRTEIPAALLRPDIYAEV
jgi:Putative antitoxin of bacterial toxin-antitoxin system, YdaS/YdaT